MKNNRSLIKFTIYWTGFASMMNMLCHPISASIAEEFPGIDFSTITMITTVGSCMLAVLAFTSTALLKKFGKKTLMLVGAVLATIGGVGGNMIVSIPFMMMMRCILGAGAGILLTVAMVMIPVLFPDPKEYAQIEGINAAFGAITGVILSTMSGKIAATVGWRFSYLLYLVYAVQVILIILYIPDDKAIRELEKKNNSGAVIKHKGSNKYARLLGVEAFVFCCVTTLIFSWSSVLVRELGIGGPQEAGYVSSAVTAGSFLGGFVFSWMFNKIRLQTAAGAFAIMAVGAFLSIFSSQLFMIIMGALIFGIGYGVYFPFLYGRAADYSEPENLDSNMAIVNGWYYLGLFGSSWFTKLLGAITHNESAVFNFKILGWACVILLVYYSAKGMFEKKHSLFIK